jgi:hypothetical protein
MKGKVILIQNIKGKNEAGFSGIRTRELSVSVSVEEELYTKRLHYFQFLLYFSWKKTQALEDCFCEWRHKIFWSCIIV